MRINNLLQPEESYEGINLISEECSQFIQEVGDTPLLKNFPDTYDDFHKVKVRKRKQRKQDPKGFSKMFNKAFEDSIHNLRERAIFAYSQDTFLESVDPTQEAFYIFPIDGYEFMYSKEVQNSSVNYKTAFDSIMEQLGTNEGGNIISELLKFNYTNNNLIEGIQSGSEIIIYNIPYFYAIRKRSVSDYNTLISNIISQRE